MVNMAFHSQYIKIVLLANLMYKLLKSRFHTIY